MKLDSSKQESSDLKVFGVGPKDSKIKSNFIVNILSIFCNLRSCGYSHAVTTDNSDIACDATSQRKILGATRDFK